MWYNKNMLSKLKPYWPILTGVLSIAVWMISQYYDVTGRVKALELDRDSTKSAQMREVEARQELIQKVDTLTEKVSGTQTQVNDVKNIVLEMLKLLKQ